MSPVKATSIFAKRSHLKVLVAVADTGSLGRAANILGSSQPALSRLIAEFEVIAGVPLFDREIGRGMSPTIVGIVAVEHARRVLRAMEEADAAVETVREALADC